MFLRSSILVFGSPKTHQYQATIIISIRQLNSMFFLETSQFPVSMWSTTLVKKSPECAYRLSRLEIVFMHAHAHKQTHTQIYIYMCQQKPSVSSSLKLSYVTFKTCISCRRTALPAATNDFERVHFAWQVRCFAMVVKISISFSVAGVRDSHVF